MSKRKPNKAEYVIGYQRPPESTRFKQGQSGNPKGRPKGSKNFATVLDAELDVRVSITENGIRKTVSKREATAKHLVNKALSGDLPAVKILLGQQRQLESEMLPMLNVPRELSSPDQLVLKNLRQRLRLMEPESETTETPDSQSAEGRP